MIDDVKEEKRWTGLKVYQIIKTFFYLALAVSLIVMKETWLAQHRYLIGGLMCLYGLEGLVISIIQKEWLKYHFYQGMIETFLGVVTIIFVDDFETICIMWGVWSIIRESGEIQDAVVSMVNKGPGLISLILSIVVLLFSAKIIIDPTEEVVLTHFTLLAIELIATALGVYFENLYIYVFSKRDNIWIRIDKAIKKNKNKKKEAE